MAAQLCCLFDLERCYAHYAVCMKWIGFTLPPLDDPEQSIRDMHERTTLFKQTRTQGAVELLSGLVDEMISLELHTPDLLEIHIALCDDKSAYHLLCEWHRKNGPLYRYADALLRSYQAGNLHDAMRAILAALQLGTHLSHPRTRVLLMAQMIV
jgi:hypothetical protein